MKKASVIIALAVVAANPHIVQAQSLLDRIGKVVSKASTSLQGSSTPIASVQPTQQQEIDTRALVSSVATTPEVSADLAETASLVTTLVQTSACAVNDSAWNALNRLHQRPTTWSQRTTRVAHNRDQYHDESTCYDVVRVTDVSKPAANALKFTAYYISPSSQRGSRQSFIVVKSSSGEWLIRDIGMVFS